MQYPSTLHITHSQHLQDQGRGENVVRGQRGHEFVPIREEPGPHTDMTRNYVAYCMKHTCLALMVVVLPSRHVHRVHAPIVGMGLRGCMHVCLHSRTHIRIHTYTCIYTYIYTHAHQHSLRTQPKMRKNWPNWSVHTILL